MATVTIELKKGLKIGETVHTEAEIREATAGDVIEAMEESEKLVMVGSEPQLIASPTLVGVNTLRRQIVRIGTYQGPLSLGEIKRLDPHDLNELQLQSELLDAGAGAEITRRGRDDRGQG
ncbi:phage tail assembly protein [Pseudomonas sp.]|uniref:phage tail assembly protein n=1 Tax=Pseudomonas sp. TaxID=306 RepID=UPI003D14F487